MKDEKKRKKPYYSPGAKREVVRQHERGVSAKELSELHGILGSNTIGDWQKKYGTSAVQNPPYPMESAALEAINGEAKEKRRLRQRRYEQDRISELEYELEQARLRVRLYACAIEVASEEMGVDLLKKIGSQLSAGHTRKDL